MENQQYVNMQYAMKKFGELFEYNNDVINATINDTEIINNLIANYNGNDYPKFERNLFKTESAIMFDFLKYTNDIEMNGVLENFDMTYIHMQNSK